MILEKQFIERYRQEKDMYMEWGTYVCNYIVKKIKEKYKKEYYKIIKIKPEPRLKEEDSIIEKAYYRGKNYKDPYLEITDKIGVRFVVMIEDQIEEISNIIMENKEWDAIIDKDYRDIIEKNPEFFEYESKHFIIRNKMSMKVNNKTINSNTPCEVQIRTLVQHAYAEISHDLVYKKKEELPSTAKRMLARSVAFNEAVDNEYKGIYEVVNKKKQSYKLYVNIINKNYENKFNEGKLSETIFEEFKDLIEKDGQENIQEYINNHKNLYKMIMQNVEKSIIFKEVIIILIYYLVSNHSSELLERWDYDEEVLKAIYTDLGKSYDNY